MKTSWLGLLAYPSSRAPCNLSAVDSILLVSPSRSESALGLNTLVAPCSAPTFAFPRLKTKIRIPHENLTNHLNRLQRLQVASDALRRISRFVTLSRRLESQMTELDRIKAAPPTSVRSPPPTSPNAISPPPTGLNINTAIATANLEPEGDLERVVSQAALYVAELATLTADDPSTSTSSPARTEPDVQDESSADDGIQTPETINLKSISLVERQLPAINAARARINAEMENMVLAGLDSLVCLNLFCSQHLT